MPVISRMPGKGQRMRKIAKIVAAAAILASPMVGVQTAQAADVSNDTTVYTPAPAPPPGVQLLDCAGTTGNMGCGPGWYWRDGWHGWACYPC
jgi:hypothetical protein